MGRDDVVARARALIGVRFRPQGRDAEYGLDCIGVVASTFALNGVARAYPLRSGNAGEAAAGLAEHGFATRAEREPGDVLLMHAGHSQLHLAIVTPGGFIHADAGLRRVVEVPGEPAWPVASVWRHVDPAAKEEV